MGCSKSKKDAAPSEIGGVDCPTSKGDAPNVTALCTPGGVAKFNAVLYQPPRMSAYLDKDLDSQIIWVSLARYGGVVVHPFESKTDPKLDKHPFPCRLMIQRMTKTKPRHLIIFFHKNADDLTTCKAFCDMLYSGLQTHVLAVEFPGYGKCQTCSPSTGQLMKHAFAAVNFVQEGLNWNLENVIVLGASIGTGPAVAVAGTYEKLGGLALISPMYNLKLAVRSHFGILPATLVEEQFPNDYFAPKIKCPTLIIHGDRDKIIPVAHGRKLYELCQGQKLFVTPEGEGHNINFKDNAELLFQPFRKFFGLPAGDGDDIHVPLDVYDRHQAYATGRKS